MNKKPPLPITAFIGGPQTNAASIAANNASNAATASMCFSTPAKSEKQRDHHQANAGSSGLCGCHKAPKSHCISATGVLILVLLYTAMGSIIFVTLEGELDDTTALETAVAASKPYPRNELATADIRSRTVDRLWSITEDLNILYKENWTRLAAQEVQHFQDTLLRTVRSQSKVHQTGVPMNPPSHKWTYASAFLYSLTLITTIGYGGISPRTQWGRIAALVYALFGIPIVLLYLSAMGEGLSAGMRCLFRKARSKSAVSNGNGGGNSSNSSGSSGVGNKNKLPGDGGGKHKNKSAQHFQAGKMLPSHQYGPMSKHCGPTGGSPSVPISICVMVLICYITSGALLFHKMQNWSVLEALYFCFTSLGTIGFGELTPSGNLTLYLASGYILIGMAVVAMCFSLIQTELLMWLRRFSVQDHVMPQSDDVSLVSVAVTPKSS
ncbi:TWiK family of potassium channels protein 18 [Stomoxys calcitrans]|uniref:TWiK family of potassium channels protein 18 n=1 Tax=Stomoxys calcitrans TaxID=35570 RepID=UPI0027E23682|nr:TWiK family of potassium channels protein 18 [Stomoxys calcitrans]